ncbi:DUF413 domain-containing protein [Vibrio palustris]|uniref:Macrodomain Ori protein n=1 Tax=Vibrio palustris TaxID=1918946 RepID=A0A1R4B5Z8_9VIBR|nr:DUF413 domain-containing protein [Vibrio palustris]SJL84338.1 hypothetical protein VPAL9027_02320 [Vibrio palustris]
MLETAFRQGKKHFYDNKKFSRGFAKSGDFTLAEENILTVYGETMLGLELGTLTAETQEEAQFINVLINPDLAKTKLEKVWIKYVRLARGRKSFHTLHGHNKPDDASDYVDTDADNDAILSHQEAS